MKNVNYTNYNNNVYYVQADIDGNLRAKTSKIIKIVFETRSFKNCSSITIMFNV